MRLTILHVEDSRVVARLVCNRLAAEGWQVEMCADGRAAFNRLVGEVRYDLLLLDNELPGMSGLELTRYARQLPRYRKTPIIMLSAGDYETEARGAGVDLFLRKPEGIDALVESIKRLIE
jgi:two-component system chemotaxis response regulator CheY